MGRGEVGGENGIRISEAGLGRLAPTSPCGWESLEFWILCLHLQSVRTASMSGGLGWQSLPDVTQTGRLAVTTRKATRSSHCRKAQGRRAEPRREGRNLHLGGCVGVGTGRSVRRSLAGNATANSARSPRHQGGEDCAAERILVACRV